MTARAMWKGVVTFGDVRLPVKMYAAIEDRGVHFRLLCAVDSVPVEQRMVHPETGDVVAPDEILRGIAMEDGAYRILDPDELEAVRPEPSRDIRVQRFVPRAAVADAWYERPYWLGPDGDASDYFALTAALAERDRVGIVRWTMRNRSHVGGLVAENGYLALPRLRFAGEVIASEELEAPSGRELSKRELDMATRLVTMLEDDFRPEEFRNQYRDRLLELIEAKARGQVVALRARKPRAPTEDLAEALERSLKRAGGRRRAS